MATTTQLSQEDINLLWTPSQCTHCECILSHRPRIIKISTNRNFAFNHESVRALFLHHLMFFSRRSVLLKKIPITNSVAVPKYRHSMIEEPFRRWICRNGLSSWGGWDIQMGREAASKSHCPSNNERCDPSSCDKPKQKQ